MKFAINELHFIEIIVDRSWDFELTSSYQGIRAISVLINEVRLYPHFVLLPMDLLMHVCKVLT